MKERITYLFMKYYKNESTRLELEEFFDLIKNAQDDTEIEALIKTVYNEIKLNNPSLTYINEDGELVLNDPKWLHEHQEEAPIRQKRSPLLSAILVACLVLIIPAALWFTNSVPSAENVHSISMVKKFTSKGEQKYIVLEDGTQVWLNAMSTITFPEKFDNKLREVHLSGEAFFDVKHADKIPFIIRSGNVSTKVLGTSFNVKAYPNQKHISIAVKRGKVEVLEKDHLVATLVKGESVKLKEETDKVIKIKESTEEKEVGAWQQGYFIYRDAVFSDIISDIEQTYNTKISIENKNLNAIVITTSFNQDIGVKEALLILCNLINAELEVNKNQYVIKK